MFFTNPQKEADYNESQASFQNSLERIRAANAAAVQRTQELSDMKVAEYQRIEAEKAQEQATRVARSERLIESQRISSLFERANMLKTYADQKQVEADQAQQKVAEAAVKDQAVVSDAWLGSSNPLVAVSGNIVNAGAAAAGTVYQALASAAAVPESIVAGTYLGQVPDNVLDTYNKLLVNKDKLATITGKMQTLDKNSDEYIKLAEQFETVRGLGKTQYNELNKQNPNSGKGYTYLDTLKQYEVARANSNATRDKDALGNDTVDSAVNWTNRRAMNQLATTVQNDRDVIRASNDAVMLDRKADALMLAGDKDGANKARLSAEYARARAMGNSLLRGLEEGITNPEALSQTLGESVPYFLLPKIGAASYTLKTGQESADKYRQANQGQIATGGDFGNIVGTSLAAGAANFIGSNAINKLFTRGKGTQQAIVNNGATRAFQGDMAAKTFLGSVANVARRTAKPALIETGAEGFQSAIESGIGYGESYNPIETGIGAALGGLMGGAIGTLPALKGAIGVEMNNTPEKVAARQKEQDTYNEQVRVSKLDDAVISDNKSPEYNPLVFVNRLADRLDATNDVQEKSALSDEIAATLSTIESTITQSEDLLVKANNFKANPAAFEAMADQALQDAINNGESDEVINTIKANIAAKRDFYENVDVLDYRIRIDGLVEQFVQGKAVYTSLQTNMNAGTNTSTTGATNTPPTTSATSAPNSNTSTTAPTPIPTNPVNTSTVNPSTTYDAYNPLDGSFPDYLGSGDLATDPEFDEPYDRYVKLSNILESTYGLLDKTEYLDYDEYLDERNKAIASYMGDVSSGTATLDESILPAPMRNSVGQSQQQVGTVNNTAPLPPVTSDLLNDSSQTEPQLSEEDAAFNAWLRSSVEGDNQQTNPQEGVVNNSAEVNQDFQATVEPDDVNSATQPTRQAVNQEPQGTIDNAQQPVIRAESIQPAQVQMLLDMEKAQGVEISKMPDPLWYDDGKTNPAYQIDMQTWIDKVQTGGTTITTQATTNARNQAALDAFNKLIDDLPKFDGNDNAVLNTAQQLLLDMNNGLTDVQRNRLRVVSAAIRAANEKKTIKITGNFVDDGGIDTANQTFFGIKEYLSDLSKAIKGKNIPEQNKLIARLAKFLNSHTKKAKVAREAYDSLQGNEIILVLRSGDDWVMQSTDGMTKKEIADAKGNNAGLAISKVSSSLVKTIESEVQSLNSLVEFTEQNVSENTKMKDQGKTVKDMFVGLAPEQITPVTAKRTKPKAQPKPTETSQPDMFDDGVVENVQSTAPSEPVVEDTEETVADPFAGNKVFTSEAVAAARAVILKAMKNTFNSGFDPALMVAGMTIAGAYVESGVRSFSKFSQAMVADFGADITKHLLSFWEGIRANPDIDTSGMTSTAESKTLYDQAMSQLTKPKQQQQQVVPERVQTTPNEQDNFDPFDSFDQQGFIEGDTSWDENDSFEGFDTSSMPVDEDIPLDERDLSDSVADGNTESVVQTKARNNRRELPESRKQEKTKASKPKEFKPIVAGDLAVAVITEGSTAEGGEITNIDSNTDSEGVEDYLETENIVTGAIPALDVTDKERAAQQKLSRSNKERTPEVGTGFQEANQAVANFGQSDKSVLGLVNDFMVQSLDDFVKQVQSYFPNAFSNGETSLLKSFYNFNKEYTDYLSTTFEVASNKFRFNDYVKYLANEDGTLPSNVYTAMSVASYSWLGENANKFLRTKKEVIALLGGKDGDILDEATYQRYAKIGLLRSAVIRELGTKVFDSLGLKLLQGANKLHKERMINSLGAMAYRGLQDSQYLNVNNEANFTFMNDKELLTTGALTLTKEEAAIAKALDDLYGTTNAKVRSSGLGNEVIAAATNVVYFVTAGRNTFHPTKSPDGVVIKDVTDIAEVKKSSNNLLNRLFGVSVRQFAPVLEAPDKLNQATIDGLGTQVPSALRERVEAMQKIPQRVLPTMVDAYRLLYKVDPQALYEMLGLVPESVYKLWHITKQLNQKALNDSIVRSVEDAFEALDSIQQTDENGSTTYPDTFLNMSVWSVNRIGVLNNLLNEQGNKVHRSMTTPSGHKVEVAFDSFLDSQGMITDLGRYFLALGSQMEEAPVSVGKKADGTTAANYLPSLWEYLTTSNKVIQGIAAMRDLRNGKPSKAGTDAIAAAVTEFGMGAMSLNALNSLVDFFDAYDGKKNSFTSELSFGSDGVNNGVVIAELLYGTASDLLLNQGGIYKDTDGITNVMTFKSQGNKDYYETLGDYMLDGLIQFISNNPNMLKWTNSLAYFDKDFASRKGAKVVAVPANYGAGMKSVIRAMTAKVVDNFYDTMAANKDNPEVLKEIQKTMNTLLGDNRQIAITAKNAQELILSPAQWEDVFKAIKETRGVVTQAALEKISAPLQEARSDMLVASQAGFEIYDRLLTKALELATKEAQENGKIPSRVDAKGKTVYLDKLSDVTTSKITDELSQYDSRIVSANGIDSDNAWESAHRTYDSRKAPIDQSEGVAIGRGESKAALNSVNPTTGKPEYVPNVKYSPYVQTKSIGRTVITNVREVKRESKGAGLSAALIVSMDARVTSLTAADTQVPATNHHDENGSSVTQAVPMAKTQNKVFLDGLIVYSLGKSITASFLQPLQGFLANHKKLGISSEGYALLDKVLEGYYSSKFKKRNGVERPIKDQDALAEIVRNFYNMDIRKLYILLDQTYFNQYATENGEYTLQPSDRVAIQAKIEELMSERAIAIEEAIKLVDDILLVSKKGNLDLRIKEVNEKADNETMLVNLVEEAIYTPDVVLPTYTQALVKQWKSMSPEVNKALQEFIANSGKTVKVSDLLKVITDSINKVTRTANGKLPAHESSIIMLSKMLNMVLDSNMEITLVDPNGDLTGVVRTLKEGEQTLAESVAKVQGWSVTETGQVFFNIKAGTAIDVEAILHELTHAATARVMKTNLANMGGSLNTTDAIDSLLELVEKAKVALSTSNIKLTEREAKLFKYALSSPTEFVAVLFSNAKFQQFLSSIIVNKTEGKQFKSSTLFNKVKSWIANIFKRVGALSEPIIDIESALERAIRASSVVMQDTLDKRDWFSTDAGKEAWADYTAKEASQAANTIDNLPDLQAVNEVTDYTATELFNGLEGDLSEDFNNNLRKVMTLVTDKSYDVLQHFGLIGGKSYQPFQVWNKAKTEGRTPYVSGLVQAGFDLSEKEQFAVESIEVTITAAIANGFGSSVYSEMLKAYNSAKNSLSNEDFHDGDWTKATDTEQAIAKNKRDALFSLGSNNRDLDVSYIARFIALGLGSEKISGMLGFPTTKPSNVGEDTSWFAKASNYLSMVMDWVNGYLTRTLYIQNIDAKLPVLAMQLIEIDAKKRDSMIVPLSNTYSGIEDIVNEAGKVLMRGTAKLLEPLAKASNRFTPGIAKPTQAILRGQFTEILDVIAEFRDLEHPNSKLGWKAEFLNELNNPTTVQKAVAALIRRFGVLQAYRQRIIEATRDNTLALFKEKPSLEVRGAVTKVVLRSALLDLLTDFGITGIKKLLSNPVYRNAEINKLESQVLTFSRGNLMLARVKDLAYYQVKGEGRIGLAKNSEAIARHVGTGFYTDFVIDSEVATLDKLAALYTMKYQDSKDIDMVVDLIEKESSAVETLMKYQNQLNKASVDTLFEGNTNSMVRGYLPEIINTHREVRIASTQKEVDELLKMGFAMSHEIRIDGRDGGASIKGKRIVFFAEETTKQRYVTGAMSIQSTAGKGTSIFGTELTDANRSAVLKRASAEMEKALMIKANDPKYDPAKQAPSTIPRYAADGSIIDYVYEMHSVTRDSILQRKHDFAPLIGAFAGGNFDKVNSTKHNKVVMDSLYKDFTKNASKNPKEYVTISKDSTDPKLQQIWATIPEKTRAYAVSLWGDGGIVMSNKAVLATFGYSKWSVGTMFDKEPKNRNAMEAMVVQLSNLAMPANAKIQLMRADRAWVEAVGFIKDVVVVRNGLTLIGNSISNMAILVAMGVNPLKLSDSASFAVRGGLTYRKDLAIKISIEQRLAVGDGDINQLRDQLRNAEDSLNRNPLRKYIEAGLLPTAVEDLESIEDDYSYKSKLIKKVGEIVPQGVKRTFEYLMVSPSTPLYKFLTNATQFSDFAAKYTIIEHLTTMPNQPKTFEEAVEIAEMMFINYGVPTSPELQAMNDRGFLMFTKYAIRIQRAMLYLLKEYPTTALAQTFLAGLGNAPGALSPVVGLGNPFTIGALNLPGVFVEPAPIKALMGMTP